MARQHFAMRVNVDSAAFGLVEQLGEIQKIVAGNADALTLHGRHADLGGLGVSVGAGVCRIEQLHDLKIQLAGLHCPIEKLIDRGMRQSKEIECCVKCGVDYRIFVIENKCMIGIGGGALEPVED